MTPELFKKFSKLPAGELTSMYVALRDERDQLNRQKKYKQKLMDQLAVILQQKLDEAQVQSFRALSNGKTVYRYELITALVEDRDALIAFVKEHDAFDLLETRASKAACQIYATTPTGELDDEGNPILQGLPPGVRLDTHVKLGVQ